MPIEIANKMRFLIHLRYSLSDITLHIRPVNEKLQVSAVPSSLLKDNTAIRIHELLTPTLTYIRLSLMGGGI